MGNFHRPTVVTTLIGVVILLAIYHVTLGRKKGSE